MGSADDTQAIEVTFEATVQAIQLPNPVPVGTEVVFHCGAVKQAARLLEVDDGQPKFAVPPQPQQQQQAPANDMQSRLKFRFVHCAEFVRVGARCAFRDASAGADNLSLGVGWVSKVLPSFKAT